MESIKMPSLASAIKSEITRIAQKEATAAVKELRAENRGLKTTISRLEQRIEQLESRPVATVAAAVAAPAPRAATTSSASSSGAGLPRTVSVASFKKERKRLDLTQKEMGERIGVSGQSIYQYERRKGQLKLKPAVMAKYLELTQAETPAAATGALTSKAPAAPSAGKAVLVPPSKIRKIRKTLSITQGELGKLIGVSGQSIYQYERKATPVKLKPDVAQKFNALAMETSDSIRATLGAPAKRGRKAAVTTTPAATKGTAPVKGGVVSSSKIRATRNRLGISQGELGKLIGVSGQSIYQYERRNGPVKMKPPVFSAYSDLANETSDSIRQIIGEAPKRGRKKAS